MTASFARYRLHFAETAITSRDVMNTRDVWLICLRDESNGREGIGEAALFAGLSCDDRPDYESTLAAVCHAINTGAPLPELTDFPSILTGLETARASLGHPHPWTCFPSDFTRGVTSVTINGLIWMGSREKMLRRIDEKIAAGFRTIKIKIGGIDFDREVELLDYIRRSFSPRELTLRLDANGSFPDLDTAMARLERLSRFDIHSIEQPVKPGQPQVMNYICRHTPIPVALDEELIGVNRTDQKRILLDEINPQYIILKPTLHGAFSGSREWIELAEQRNIGWWITSALESNIGLNAIAQWTARMGVTLPQGLGTGGLFTNNFATPLRLNGECLSFQPGFEGFELNKHDLQWITP